MDLLLIITIIIIGLLLLIRKLWKAYTHPSHVLTRQAANMNWVATGKVKDHNGYFNVRLRRDNLVTEISFKDGNVILIEPYRADPFSDYVELEIWLAKTNQDHNHSKPNKSLAKNKAATKEEENVDYGEILDDLRSIYADFVSKTKFHNSVINRKRNVPDAVRPLEKLFKRNVPDATRQFEQFEKKIRQMTKYNTAEQSLQISCYVLLLVLEIKYINFRNTESHKEFKRQIFPRIISHSVEWRGFIGLGHLPPRSSKENIENANEIYKNIEKIVSEVKDNFVNSNEYPTDPIFNKINSQLSLIDKDKANPKNRDKFYKPIFTKLCDKAKNRI